MENIEYNQMRIKTKKWLYENGTSGLQFFVKDFEDDEKQYIELQTKLDIAMKILNKYNYFEGQEMLEFIEENDALFAVYDLIFRLDQYDLPRAFIILLPIELYQKALEFVLKKLEVLKLTMEYNRIIKQQNLL